MHQQSCNLPNAIIDRVYADFEKRELPKPMSTAGLDASVIPSERMELMKAKYQEYKKKWPKMKDQRIVRKVAEYFKIKLVGKP